MALNLCLLILLGEAIEKMLQEKKISTKINYEVLKSLNVNLTASNKEPQKVEEEPVRTKMEEDNTISPTKM